MDSPNQLLNKWGQTVAWISSDYNRMNFRLARQIKFTILQYLAFQVLPLFSGDYIKSQRPFFLFINLNAVWWNLIN